jgi:predicted SnoaL-like aldol condensation-catalyzing enzyme
LQAFTIDIPKPTPSDTEKDFVVMHERFSGFGAPANWIAPRIVRIKDGLLAEHWDVIEGEATQEQSKCGHPMFGDTFPR